MTPILRIVTEPTIEPLLLSDVKSMLGMDTSTFADFLEGKVSIALDSHSVAASYSLVGASLAVDGYKSLVQLNTGTFTTGTVDVKLQESTDDAVWTDVSGGAFTQVTSSTDETLYEKEYTGALQYLRVVATVATASCDFAVTIQKLADTSAVDAKLNRLIKASRLYAEEWRGEAFINQTWGVYRDTYPSEAAYQLPKWPLVSVAQVKHKDSDGNVTTLVEDTDYIVDITSRPGRIVLPFTKSWPSATYWPVLPVDIRFIAGYGATRADVPDFLKEAMLEDIRAHFEAGDDVDTHGPGGVELFRKMIVNPMLDRDRVFYSAMGM